MSIPFAKDRPLCGIFIGGASRRMGGRPKGLLRDPETGQTLVARLAALIAQRGLPCVLVGQRPEYAALGMPMLADCPAGIGPLGGLAALLRAAPHSALALACDLPYLKATLLDRLLWADLGGCDVVAPARQGRWEPLCAHYKAAALPSLEQALSVGERSFQRLFLRLRVVALPLDDLEQHELDDWDEPLDLVRGRDP